MSQKYLKQDSRLDERDHVVQQHVAQRAAAAIDLGRHRGAGPKVAADVRLVDRHLDQHGVALVAADLRAAVDLLSPCRSGSCPARWPGCTSPPTDRPAALVGQIASAWRTARRPSLRRRARSPATSRGRASYDFSRSTSPSLARSSSSVTSSSDRLQLARRAAAGTRPECGRAVSRRAPRPSAVSTACSTSSSVAASPSLARASSRSSSRSFSRDCVVQRLLRLGDVAHAVLGHVQFQLPRPARDRPRAAAPGRAAPAGGSSGSAGPR